MPYEFITSLVKPWDNLSRLLSKPYAFEPEINDPIREAGHIAVALRHQSEKVGVDLEEAKRECQALEVLIDVGDSFKHGTLRNAARANKLSISSQFEFRSGPEFRFIRNSIRVEHVAKGSFDLLLLEAEAISYWLYKLRLPLQWSPTVLEAPPSFSPKITLWFNPEHQVHMASTVFTFYKRDPSGVLVLSDPPHFEFEILELVPEQPNNSLQGRRP